MWKYAKVCVNPRRGNTRFHMRKFTWNRAFPHVEIHQKLWISHCAEILISWCISACGNSSGKVNFRMSIYKRICEFPRGKTCGNTPFFGDFHMRKYTRKCEFPRAEIHAERCITACGNTLNRVQKNSSSRGKRKYAPLGMRLLWKYINYFLVYHLTSHFFLYLQNYKEFEAEILDLQLEKYGLSFDIKKYTTSGWGLGDENVIGIKFFKPQNCILHVVISLALPSPSPSTHPILAGTNLIHVRYVW